MVSYILVIIARKKVSVAWWHYMVSYILVIICWGDRWTYAVILPIEPLRTNLTQVLIEETKISFYLPNYVHFIELKNTID